MDHFIDLNNIVMEFQVYLSSTYSLKVLKLQDKLIQSLCSHTCSKINKLYEKYI